MYDPTMFHLHYLSYILEISNNVLLFLTDITLFIMHLIHSEGQLHY